MAQRGRRQKWSETDLYRLWEFVRYYTQEMRPTTVSIRQACEFLSKREPWSGLGVGAATLRRRYQEAEGRWRRGVAGWRKHLDFNFVLSDDDQRSMRRFQHSAWVAECNQLLIEMNRI
jgi:hypothetical protein